MGNASWDRTYDGSANDVLKAVRETAGGGGFILGGYSESPADGTKTTSKFAKFADAWLVRIDGDGQQLWDHSYWSSRVPQEYYAETFVEALEQAENGDFVFGGTVAAAIAQFPSAFWVARTDENGNELWDWDLGFVYGYALQTLKMAGDSGVLIGGKDPVRVARLDAEGMLLWERVFSLDAGFELRSIQQTRDGGCIIGVRSTTGVAYEKTVPNYGASDYWIVKFAADAPRLRAIAPLAGSNVLGLELFPGTTNHSYRIDCSTNLENWTALQTNRTATYKIEITNTNRSLRFYRAERLPD